jgi:hypothetical protein
MAGCTTCGRICLCVLNVLLVLPICNVVRMGCLDVSQEVGTVRERFRSPGACGHGTVVCLPSGLSAKTTPEYFWLCSVGSSFRSLPLRSTLPTSTFVYDTCGAAKPTFPAGTGRCTGSLEIRMVYSTCNTFGSTALARVWSWSAVHPLDQLGVSTVGFALFHNVIPVVLVTIVPFGCIGQESPIEVESVQCRCSIGWEWLCCRVIALSGITPSSSITRAEQEVRGIKTLRLFPLAGLR